MLIKPLVIVLGSLLVFCLAALRSLILLFRWLVRRSKGTGAEPAPQIGKAVIWTQRVVFVVAGLEVVAFAYALTVEPYWLEVTRTTVPVDALPAGARPIRIAHITDLHTDPEARVEERLPEVIEDLEPDAIVFTGDAVNSPEALSLFQQTMSRLARIAPTFAVRGNWDVWYWADLDLFEGTGVRELDGEAVRLPVSGAEVWISGAAVGNGAAIEQALGAVPHDALSIFLHHFPERIREAEPLGADLVLSGDTHGGQVRLPLLGAVIEMVRFSRYFDVGLHRVGGAHVYVSRGIGMEGGHAPRVRFFCRPEVALLELVPSP